MIDILLAVLALFSSTTGNVDSNEQYVADQLSILMGQEIPAITYYVERVEDKRSWTDGKTMYLARPSMGMFRHELTHIYTDPLHAYSPNYDEALAEYIRTRLGDYTHPYERLQNYGLSPLVCAGHIPTYLPKQGGDNTWYAYQTWALVIRQQQLARDMVTIEEFYKPTHIAYWLEAYRAVCRGDNNG